MGTLSIYNSTLFGNDANNARGGGILNQSGTTTIYNSTLSENTAGDRGGGIYATNATLTSITNSTLSRNSANNGGGIYNISGGPLTIYNSTFSGNVANSAGGGINHKGSGALTIFNSTFSGNQSTSLGAGIENSSSANAYLYSSIVANSIGGDDIFTATTMYVNDSLVEDGGVGSISGTPLTGDPNLGPLYSNGGPTKTHSLLSGSIAIDAGNDNGFVTDQRGALRVINGQSDIGAFESDSNPNFIVTNESDFDDSLLSNFIDGSLRAVLLRANAFPGQQTITFDPGVSTINLTDGELPITDDVIIQGLGASQLTVDGTGSSRIFYVDDSDAGLIDVEIIGMTLTGVASIFNGGAIYNKENLTISESTLSGNIALSGGGIFNLSGTLTISNSTLSGNFANRYGGGIFNDSGTLTISNSTLSGNSASVNRGGGIFNQSGTLTISNSTLSGNSADLGGGVYNQGTLDITSSIIASNIGGSLGPDIYGNATSNGYNWIGDISDANITPSLGTDILGVSAAGYLAPLAFTGGPTQTHALINYTSNPALDAGSAPPNSTDQRGFLRDATPDIGAFESGNLVVTTDQDTIADDGYTSLREAIAQIAPYGTISFDPVFMTNSTIYHTSESAR